MRHFSRLVLALIAGAAVSFGTTLADRAGAQEIMPTPTPTPSATPTPTPTAPGFVKVPVPGSSTSASTQDGNVPANSVDGSLATRWSGFGDGAWLQFDFGVTRVLHHVKVAAHLGNQRRNMFEIHVSNDAVVWTPVTNGATSGTTTQLETFQIPWPHPNARYMRYVGHGNSDPTKAGWNSVTEMEAWAYPATVPAAPTNLRAQPDAGRVTLTWNGGSATEFRIFRRLSQCDTYAQVGTSNAATFTDTTVVDRRHYYYYVVGANSVGTSPASAAIAVTPQIQPPAPPALTATSGPADSGRIDLSWTPVASATRYTIKRAVRNFNCVQPPPATIATVNAPATAYSDATATPGVVYAYAISATNITGEGPNSPIVTVTAARDQAPTPPPTPTPCPTGTPTPTPVMPTGTPAAPIALTVEEANARVRLTWSQPPNTFPNHAKRFNVYRGLGPCGPYTQIAREALGSSYVDAGLSNETLYYYFVVGTNELGESLDSETVAGTPRNVPPPVPERPTVLAGAASLEVRWNVHFAADSYTLKRSETSGGPYTVIANRPTPPAGSVISHIDSAVVAGRTYYYVVEATNPAGPSGNSPEASGTVPGGSLTAPSGVLATSGTSSIALSWNAVSGATGYRVYRTTSRCAPSAFTVVASPSGNSYTDPVAGNGRYLYRVTAVSASSESAPSEIVSATSIRSVPAPSLSATGGTSVQLSWSPFSTANGYAIYRRLPASGTCIAPIAQLLQTVPPTATTYTDSVVSAGMTYEYQVRGLFNGWPGPMSPGALATVSGTNEFATPRPTPCPTGTPTPTPPAPSGPLTAPTSVTATAGNREVRVNWGNGTGSYGYRVYRGTAACGPFVHIGGRAYWEQTPVVDAGLTNGVTYYYLVVATGQQGQESAEPAVVSATPATVPPLSAPRNVIGSPGDTRARVHWSPVYSATSYEVRRSTDGLNYTTAGTSTTDSFIDPGLANGTLYWYLVTGGNTSGQGPHGGPAQVRPQDAYVEITPGAAAVTGSTHDGNVPANTVDNNLGTRWSGNGNGAWVQYDLGSRHIVAYVTVAAYQGNQRRNTFEIQTSLDGITFNSPRSYTTSGQTLAEERFDLLSPVFARYVRYLGRGATINSTGAFSSWNSVTEVSLFGQPAPTPTPTPICSTPPPTPTAPPPPTNVGTAAGDGRVTITWTSSFYRHRVLRSTTSGGPYQVVGDVFGGGQAQYVDTAVVNGTLYYYVVHAYDQKTSEPGCPPWTWTMNGPRSVEVSATPGSAVCAEWVPPSGYTPESSPWDPVTDPRNLFDNNLATRWSANGDGAWFKVDLGSPRTLCWFAMAVYRGDTRRQIFDLQVSTDNVTWTSVLNNAQSTIVPASPPPQEMFEFADATARWVRWVGHGHVTTTGTPGTWNSLTEVDFMVR